MRSAAAAGIGQTAYAKDMGRTELELACDAIRAACDDAGLRVPAVDGFVSYHIEQVAEVDLVTALDVWRGVASRYGVLRDALAGRCRRGFRQCQRPLLAPSSK
jgi:acetyl-CoA acetyltransferase